MDRVEHQMYYTIVINNGYVEVETMYDLFKTENQHHIESGNYFLNKQEADDAAFNLEQILIKNRNKINGTI